MKPRELSSSFSLFPAFKFLLLSALVVLFLHATFSMYTNISARYYANPRPPFLNISSIYSSPSFSSIPSSTSFNSFSSSSRITVSPLPSISNPPSPSSTSSAAYSKSSSPPPLIAPLPPPILTPSPSPQKFEEISFFNYSLASPSPPPPPPKRRGFPKGCDLAKGEWVRDPNAPYYTNSTCWAIQEHQNCMKYGRPDSDFLKWRWKPDGCELPLIEPAGFLELMRGKNLAFIGDSLARNQMQSLMCLLSRVEYPQEIWPPAEDVTQMLYKNYNFTLWTFWSPFLIRAKETMTKDNLGTWSLYLDEPDPLWQPKLGLFDFIVLNTGNWYTRPAQFYEKRKIIGCHYCVFKKIPFMSVYKAHRRAFRTALDAIVQNRQGYTGVTIVRTVSPSHFEGGDWNKGGDCKRTAPFRRGKAKIKGMDLELYKDQWKEFWKAKWEGNEKGLEFRLLDTTQAMVLRPDGHPSRYGHWPDDTMVLYNDCVHWCLPGPVDMWNDFLFQILSIP